MFPDIPTLLSTIGKTNAKEQAWQHDQSVAMANPENQALIVKETFAPAVLAVVTGKSLGAIVNAPGYKQYRDEFLAECVGPTDPLEILMLEQLFLSHHRIGALFAEGATATSPDVVEVCNASVAKLMAEHRKTTLAVKEYRTLIGAKRSASKDRSQGDEQHDATSDSMEGNLNSEKGSNHAQPQGLTPTAQSSPADGRPAEPAKAQGAHSSGAATAA